MRSFRRKMGIGRSLKKIGKKIDRHVTRPVRDIAVGTLLGTPSQHMSDKRRKEHEAEMKRIEMQDREERQRRGSDLYFV